MKILITGATGFLGKHLIKEIAPIASKIYILSRNIHQDSFTQYKNFEIVQGDITELDVIKDRDIKNRILSECDIVIHAAALYDLKADYADLYLQNVMGTKNILNLITKATSLKAFYYVSTIAVADEQSEYIDETSLPERSTFFDNYSKTKYHAEKLVREFSKSHQNIPIRIFRPGVIVGDSINGKIGNINGPYYFLELLKKYKHLLKNIAIIPLTFNPKSKLSLIPVDHVANFIFLIIKRDQYGQDLKTYHLICVDPPTIETFLKDISRILKINTKFFPIASNRAITFIMPFLNIPKEVIPFMFSKVTYDNKLTLKDLPELKTSKYASFKKIFF